jgi:hypothetical protein
MLNVFTPFEPSPRSMLMNGRRTVRIPVYCVLPRFVAEALATVPRLSENISFGLEHRNCIRRLALGSVL